MSPPSCKCPVYGSGAASDKDSCAFDIQVFEILARPSLFALQSSEVLESLLEDYPNEKVRDGWPYPLFPESTDVAGYVDLRPRRVGFQ